MQMNPLKNSSLNLISLKGNALKTSEIQNLVNDIIVIINSKIPNVNSLKRDISLVDNVVQLASNHDSKSDIDVADVALLAMTTIFPELNNLADIEILKAQINFVIESSKTVSKLSTSKKLFKNSVNWLKKKVL